MARIEGVPEERAGLLARLAYRISRRKVGKVAAPITLAAHQPWILAAVGAFELALERADRLDVQLKVLASVKASSLVGCHF
jgi:alkylhydroperoxidase family enzyme